MGLLQARNVPVHAFTWCGAGMALAHCVLRARQSLHGHCTSHGSCFFVAACSGGFVARHPSSLRVRAPHTTPVVSKHTSVNTMNALALIGGLNDIPDDDMTIREHQITA